MIRLGEERSDGLVEVTFELHPSCQTHGGSVVGDFNGWTPDADPLVRPDGGTWTVTLWLPPGRHRFRYLLDGDRWENDWDADGYEPNAFGGTDSIVDVQHAGHAELGRTWDDRAAVADMPADVAAATGPQTLDAAEAGRPPTGGEPARGQRRQQ
jgi:1,4-alpha-glucan branching enzyme